MILERIKQLNEEARQENLNSKLCLIEDYFKAKKYLLALGLTIHGDCITRAGDLFDLLYDLDEDMILLELSYLHGEISMFYKGLSGMNDYIFLRP